MKHKSINEVRMISKSIKHLYSVCFTLHLFPSSNHSLNQSLSKIYTSKWVGLNLFWIFCSKLRCHTSHRNSQEKVRASQRTLWNNFACCIEEKLEDCNVSNGMTKFFINFWVEQTQQLHLFFRYWWISKKDAWKNKQAIQTNPNSLIFNKSHVNLKNFSHSLTLQATLAVLVFLQLVK